MNFEDLQSSVNSTIIHTFKVSTGALYNGSTSIDGIFSSDYLDAGEGSVTFESRTPVFVCQSVDVPSIARNDEILVNSTYYRVTGIEPDGTGLVLLKLRTSLPNPMFSAPLTHSLVEYYSDAPGVFSRASTATVIDHEGICRDVLPEEARFPGAMRVQTFIGEDASEDMTNGYWSKYGANIDINSETEINLDIDAAQSHGIYNTTPLSDTTRQYTFSMTVTKVSGTGYFKIALGAAATATLTATEIPQRFSFTSAISDGYIGINKGFGAGVGGTVLNITEWQLELTESQTNQSPASYVSTMTPIEHGSNVSTVKYFPTTNNNSVTNNIVTSGIGSDLTTMKKLLLEETRTNIVTDSEDLSQSQFIKTAVTANVHTGYIGGRTRCRIISTNTSNLRHYVHVASTLTISNDQSFACFAAPTDECDWLFLSVSDAIDTNKVTVFYNVRTGIIGNPVVTGAAFTYKKAIIQQIKDGYYCILTVGVSVGGAAQFRFGAAQNDQNELFTASSAGLDLMYLTACHIENDQHTLKSYIPTSGGTDTRAAEILYYVPTFTITSASYFAIAFDFYMVQDLTESKSTIELIENGGNYPGWYQGLTNGDGLRLKAWDGDGTSFYWLKTGVIEPPAGENSAGFTAGPLAGSRISVVNGVEDAITPDPDETDTGTSWTADRLYIGCDYAGNGQFNDSIGNVRVYDAALSSDILKELTG